MGRIRFVKWLVEDCPKYSLKGKEYHVGQFSIGVWNWFMLGKEVGSNNIQLGFLSIAKEKYYVD